MNESFGQRLAGLRKDLRYTQEELAERLNVSPQAVSKWENDLCMPDIQLLPHLAELLHTTTDYLLGREAPMPATQLPQEERRDPQKMMLHIVVDSSDGDRVRVNLPVSVIRVCLEMGMAMPQINGNEALSGVDFQQLLAVIDQGVIGELVTVDSADGNHVVITVE